jgi:hypothetical protein
MMQLNKEEIISNFPNIKLSYENIIHKKVYSADINLAIPQGKKCFAWFTIHNEKNVCFIMEIGENKQVNNIRIMATCFVNELSYGTILYGTVLYHLNNNFFFVEDIFSYKGNKIEYKNWGYKFDLLTNLFKNDLKQVSYNNSFIVFGLPMFSNSIEDLLIQCKDCKYNIDSIQFRLFNRKNNYLFVSYDLLIERKEDTTKIVRNISTYKNNNNTNSNLKQHVVNHPITNGKTMIKNNYNNTKSNIKEREKVFQVKPDIQNDIYHLYQKNDKLDYEYFDIAFIPDYKTSVMMNHLFRNIKENRNLDALEESDDENEFENEREDRFVYLDKTYIMVCNYSYKFKKWYPVKLAKEL